MRCDFYSRGTPQFIPSVSDESAPLSGTVPHFTTSLPSPQTKPSLRPGGPGRVESAPQFRDTRTSGVPPLRGGARGLGFGWGKRGSRKRTSIPPFSAENEWRCDFYSEGVRHHEVRGCDTTGRSGSARSFPAHSPSCFSSFQYFCPFFTGPPGLAKPSGVVSGGHHGVGCLVVPIQVPWRKSPRSFSGESSRPGCVAGCLILRDFAGFRVISSNCSLRPHGCRGEI